jgi:hypothetical protein
MAHHHDHHHSAAVSPPGTAGVVPAELVPVEVPVKPMPTDELGAMTRSWARFTADTVALPGSWDQVAFHPSDHR